MYPHEMALKLQKDSHLSAKQVYNGIEMPQQTYSNKIRGKRKWKHDELVRLAGFHKVHVSVFDDNTPAPASNAKELIEKFMVMIKNGMIMSIQRVEDEQIKEEVKEKKKVKRKGQKKKRS